MTMPLSSKQEVTQLLGDWSAGDEGALEKLIPLVQPELHRLAHHYMSRERAGQTLQTTALLDEAYLRLVDNTPRSWQSRTHFVAAAAQLMRHIMVDHARERHSLKRGGGALKVTLDEAALVTETRSEELLALDEALERLAAQDPRKGQIVELRYFGGLTAEETAEFLKVSLRTVEREWNMAKAWLHRALSGTNLMKPDRWQQINDLFQSATERAPEERAAFLAEACDGDKGLRRRGGVFAHFLRASGELYRIAGLRVAPELLTNDKTGALVGELIGHYRIEALIGIGGMGEVYLARDERLGRKVALKLLPDHMTANETQLSRFKTEARAASALNHPNILTVYEIGAEGEPAIHRDRVHRGHDAARLAGEWTNDLHDALDSCRRK